MKDSYDPLHITTDEDEYINNDDYLDRKADGLFRVGQSYEDEPCKTYYCKKCNGNKFYVGTGSYFTAIKCVNCNYELCVHDG